MSKLLLAHYADAETLQLHKVKISEEDFNFVMRLRNMNKLKLKKLLGYVGWKQMLKISALSLELSVEGFKTNGKNFKVIA